jgi:hypothetical protein
VERAASESCVGTYAQFGRRPPKKHSISVALWCADPRVYLALNPVWPRGYAESVGTYVAIPRSRSDGMDADAAMTGVVT